MIHQTLVIQPQIMCFIHEKMTLDIIIRSMVFIHLETKPLRNHTWLIDQKSKWVGGTSKTHHISLELPPPPPHPPITNLHGNCISLVGKLIASLLLFLSPFFFPPFFFPLVTNAWKEKQKKKKKKKKKKI